MQRETATEQAQLPHAFAEGEGELCSVCSADAGDGRHSAYEEIAAASRETAAQAQQATTRELGT